MVLPDVSLVLQGFSTHGDYVTSFQNQNLRTGLRWVAKRIRKSIVAIDLECVSQTCVGPKTAKNLRRFAWKFEIDQRQRSQVERKSTDLGWFESTYEPVWAGLNHSFIYFLYAHKS